MNYFVFLNDNQEIIIFNENTQKDTIIFCYACLFFIIFIHIIKIFVFENFMLDGKYSKMSSLNIKMNKIFTSITKLYETIDDFEYFNQLKNQLDEKKQKEKISVDQLQTFDNNILNRYEKYLKRKNGNQNFLTILTNNFYLYNTFEINPENDQTDYKCINLYIKELKELERTIQNNRKKINVFHKIYLSPLLFWIMLIIIPLIYLKYTKNKINLMSYFFTFIYFFLLIILSIGLTCISGYCGKLIRLKKEKYYFFMHFIHSLGYNLTIIIVLFSLISTPLLFGYFLKDLLKHKIALIIIFTFVFIVYIALINNQYNDLREELKF